MEGRGASEVLPLHKKRVEVEQVLGMLKGGTRSFEVVLTRELEVFRHTEWGGGGGGLQNGGGEQKV